MDVIIGLTEILVTKDHFIQFLIRTCIQKKGNLAAQWPHNISTEWSVNNFKFASYKRVCEDHFEVSLDNMQARL